MQSLSLQPQTQNRASSEIISSEAVEPDRGQLTTLGFDLDIDFDQTTLAAEEAKRRASDPSTVDTAC